jgi:hypothetical protein
LIKFKNCDGCNTSQRIWKADARKKYCKNCWVKIEPYKTINKVSVKLKKELSEYYDKREDFFKEKPVCEANIPDCCSKKSSDVHHMKGRGENLLNTSTWISVCRYCHQFIELNPLVAKDLGYSISRLNS